MISTTYTILSNIYISGLARTVDEITGNQQYGAACTKSTTCAFCIHKILGGKKWEFHWDVHQLFTNFNKANGSVWREVLFKILIKFVIPLKPQVLRLNTMCLNDDYTTV